MTDVVPAAPNRRATPGPDWHSYVWVRSVRIPAPGSAAQARAEHEAKYQASLAARRQVAARMARVRHDIRMDIRWGVSLMAASGLMELVAYLGGAWPAREWSDYETPLWCLMLQVAGGFVLLFAAGFLAALVCDWWDLRRIKLPELYAYDPDDGIYTADAALAGLPLSADVRAALLSDRSVR